MESEERVSHAGEAGHMLKLSDKYTVFSFACALALHLGNSPFGNHNKTAEHPCSPLNSDRGRFLRAKAAESTWFPSNNDSARIMRLSCSVNRRCWFSLSSPKDRSGIRHPMSPLESNNHVLVSGSKVDV